MFSRRLSLSELIEFCRVLRHQLSAGLSIQRVLKQQSERGRGALRAIASRLHAAIGAGADLSDAFDRERGSFPPLFLAMVKVGETTGHTDQIFGELERYFTLELQLRRQFRSQTILPIVQFVFAVAIMAGVIYITGLLAAPNARPILTIFGLSGGPGALAFLGLVFGTLTTIGTFYFLITRIGRGSAAMDRLFLALPALGPCMRALAMSRFTLALQLTLDSGLSITKAIRLSLEATGNAAFASRAEVAVQALKGGQSLHEALEACRLFDDTFMEMVYSSEAAGSVPEMMRTLTQQYQEETSRKLTLLTRVAAGAVWCGVAAFIIWAIFRLAFIYLNLLDGKI